MFTMQSRLASCFTTNRPYRCHSNNIRGGVQQLRHDNSGRRRAEPTEGSPRTLQ